MGVLYQDQTQKQKTQMKTITQFHDDRFVTLVKHLNHYYSIAQMQCELYRSTSFTYSLALITVMMHQHRNQLSKLRKYSVNRKLLTREMEACLAFYMDISNTGEHDHRALFNEIEKLMATC